MEATAVKKRTTGLRRRKGLPPAAIVLFGFVVIIAAGALILCLPVCSKEGKWTPFVDALLMSASATCVTGYTFANVGTYFSGFGQAVILILVQIGGLGFMTLTTFVLMLIRKKIALKDRVALQASIGQDGHKAIAKLVRNILLFTVCTELTGALLLLPVFVFNYGAVGIWHALFVSVSAFCNAGIDVFEGGGIARYASNPYVLLVLVVLIVLGGLGFIVVADIVKHKGRFSKFSLHSKIALTVSGVLTVLGFLFFLVSESGHSPSTGGFGAGTKVLAALFESVSCRTAGFSVYPKQSLSHAGAFFRDILSFIGASPGSTGGGIKTTTVAVLFMAIISGIRRKEEVVLFRRSVAYKTVYKSLAVLLTAIVTVIVATGALLFTESASIGLEGALKEAMGAFTTVGIGVGITPGFTAAGKIIMTLTMFMGRIGMLPVGLLFTFGEAGAIRYPEANVPIG